MNEIVSAIKTCSPLNCEMDFGLDKETNTKELMHYQIEQNELCSISMTSNTKGFSKYEVEDRTLLEPLSQAALYDSRIAKLFVTYHPEEQREEFVKAYRVFKDDAKKLLSLIESKEDKGIKSYHDEEELYSP